MPISAVDTISLAVQHTKQQLFQPFRVGQWTRLAVVGLLAGELGSSGGCNGSNFNFPHQPISRHFLDPGFGAIDPALLGGLILVLVVAGLVLGIILLYISSVMRFVLFDSVLAKECHIRQGWSARQGPGWRFFLWKLLYLLITVTGVIVLVGIPAGFAFAVGWLQEPKEHVLALVLAGTAVLLLLIIFVITTAVIFVLTKDFVVPQMALENIGAIEAWGRLWPMIKAEKGGYAAYIGMKIVMAIGRPACSTRRRSMAICPTCVSASAMGPWNSFSADSCSGASEARYASNPSRAAKKRCTSWSQGSDAELCHSSLPFATESDHSSRSPMCARIWPGVRVVFAAQYAAKSGGAPRTALPPR